jgi:hypothetical protein
MDAGPDEQRAIHHTDEYVLPCEQVQQLPICHAAIMMIAKAYMREIIPRITRGKVPVLLAPNTRFQGRYVRALPFFLIDSA